MPDEQVCAKCGSGRIVPRARVIDRGHYNNDAGELSVLIYERPDALIFKRPHKGSLSARVCGDCGYTELYLDDALDFYTLYTEQERE